MRIVHTCIYITIIISLLSTSQCSITKQLKYQNCSSSNLCFSCYNQYFCQSCAPGVKCCPKYCKECENQTYCIDCQKGFEQVGFHEHQDWTACYNIDPTIDPRRITTDPTKCRRGYYFDEILQFCQKCLIPNCKLCQQSLHCGQCQAGFKRTNGICIAIEVNPTPPDQKEPIQKCNKQEKQSLYVELLIIGVLMGLCFSCILIRSFSPVKRRCGACCEWLRNKYNNRRKVEKDRLIIEDEVVNYVEMSRPHLSDQQKQFAILSEVKEDKMSYIINDHIDPKSQRKPVITQKRNKF